MCFGCHFNICARHARGGAEEGSVAAGKEPSLAIVTETSIWATRVLASSKGDQKQQKGDPATCVQRASDPSSTTKDQKVKKRGGIEEISSLLPDRVDREREQVKAALSLEAKLPAIFPGMSSLIEEDSSVGSETCHSKSRLVEEDTRSSERNKSAKYFTATNLPKSSAGVDIV